MSLAPKTEARVGAILAASAKWLAVAGGMVLVALALMTVASVLGRAMIFAGLGPISGDYELVEMGVAIAVFSFLPWCQLQRGHVTVDVLADRFPARLKLLLALVGNIALAAAAVLIAWRLGAGMEEKLPWRWAGGFAFEKNWAVEETYELGLPFWIGYALALIGAALFALTALYSVWRSVNEMAAGAERA